jgi:hypothetical protein
MYIMSRRYSYKTYMESVETDISVIDMEKMIFDVWIYVNPFTGKHAKTTNTGKLAVFVNEEVGRSWETISTALTGMIGYKATWDEMIDIATKQTGGQYELFTICCN